jgi:syntaxin-binding protein 1
MFSGSTHVWYPDWFIEDLKTLEKGGLGSATLPKGVASTGPPDPIHPQRYYDQKYWTKDAPPPPPPQTVPAAVASNGGLAPPGGAQRPSQNLTPQPSAVSVSSARTSVASDSGSQKEKGRKRDWFKF